MKLSVAIAFVLLTPANLAPVVASNSIDAVKRPQGNGKHPIKVSAPGDNSGLLTEDEVQQLAESSQHVQDTMRHDARGNQKSGAAEEDFASALRGRALRKGDDVSDVLLKNMMCGGCLQAPPLTDAVREPFLDYLGCNSEDELHLWDFKSLEKTNTWYQFENEETNECLEATTEVGGDELVCDGVILGECHKSNPHQIWGVVGGHIVNFHCCANLPLAFTPEVFLAANKDGSSCTDETDVVGLELTSLTSSSGDQDGEHADHCWVVVPTKFSGSASADEIILI